MILVKLSIWFSHKFYVWSLSVFVSPNLKGTKIIKFVLNNWVFKLLTMISSWHLHAVFIAKSSPMLLSHSINLIALRKQISFLFIFKTKAPFRHTCFFHMIYEEECNNIIHLQCLCINKAPYKATVYDIPLMIVIPGQDPINHAYFVNIVVGNADVK